MGALSLNQRMELRWRRALESKLLLTDGEKEGITVGNRKDAGSHLHESLLCVMSI